MITREQLYLPIFWWFYQSIHDFDYEYIIQDFIDEIGNDVIYNEVSEEDKQIVLNWEWAEASNIFDKYYNIDYKRYYDDYWKEFTRVFIERYWIQLESIWIYNIEYIDIDSPKYYNYDTDRININIDYDINKVKSFLQEHKEQFSKYIIKHNTSYDWFIPYWTNDFNEYLDTDSFKQFELTQIIDFYIELNLNNEDDDNIAIDMHYDVELSSFEYITINKD